LRGASETLAEDSHSGRVERVSQSKTGRVNCIKGVNRINRIKPGESPRADQANP
jgi:hypothetical protein